MKHFYQLMWTFVILVVLCFFLIDISESAARCEKWVAKVVSVQGNVQLQKSGEVQWEPVKFNNKFCTGDMVRVQKQSRAAIALSNETILRLDQNTTITFNGVEKNKLTLIEILKGVAHFFSRIPHTLKLVTPFVNGTVEGTEFLVEVNDNQSILTVFEGQVNAVNEAGSLTLTSGQSAVAGSGQAPSYHSVVQPRDAVHWALYYPPIIHYHTLKFSGASADWNEKFQQSIRSYREGDLIKAFLSIDEIPEEIDDPGFFNYRALLLLSVGRVNEAHGDIERSLTLSPDNSNALSLKSIISVVQNDKDAALNFAQRAVKADAASASALIALSYAEQANFDLNNALSSLQKAVEVDPENSIAWARLSELWLSFGKLDKALEAAEEAVKLSPGLAHTQSVLGFAYLTQIKTNKSMEAFNKAIELDQAAPLPRLGLGLAKIRQGSLKQGRQEIEIAASLDPNNSLIRSYLGKAYHEERRDKKASGQFTIAKELDPLDPTSFFYSSIRKQSINRPVEAMHDQQKSIALNNNRAIYRSKLLLDDDLAARSSSLARIYSDLGFQQLALVEGWKSVNTNPGNYSAHRFLADSYSALPRHEIARVSELLQSQLLQPINMTSVQPSLAEANLFILNGAGPGDLSFNEFNPVFNRNRLAFQLSGVAGGNDTLGDEILLTGIYNNVSISAGQFHYETDGFRENNHQDQDIYNVFTQASLSHKTSIQAEYRYKDVENGDLGLLFDPDFSFENFTEEEQTNSYRLGLHHSITPYSEFISSLVYSSLDRDTRIGPDFRIKSDEKGYMAESQYIYHKDRLRITVGAGYFSSDKDDVTTSTFIFPPFPPIIDITKSDTNLDHANLYFYSLINYPESVTLTIGASGDFFNGGIRDQDQFNPKVGFTWNPHPSTTLRAAYFRTLDKSLISSQTIEPTQVSGFNQFFDDTESADIWRYGLGIDQKVSDKIFVGGEFSKRDLNEPGTVFDPATFEEVVKEFDSDEQMGRAYLYWTPHPWLAISTEYQFENFKNPEEFTKENIIEMDTHRAILSVNFFHPSGFFIKMKPIYVSQDGEFTNESDPPIPFNGNDEFWIVDTSIGYRLPKRYGIFTLEAKNLFDEDFRFQDTDPSNPTIYPERLVVVKFNLAL